MQATRGRIVLDGRDITDVPPNQRGLGIVFQSYALFPHMTVAQNVAFGLEMRGLSRSDCATRVGRMLDLVHLQVQVHQRVHVAVGLGQTVDDEEGHGQGRAEVAAVSMRCLDPSRTQTRPSE